MENNTTTQTTTDDDFEAMLDAQGYSDEEGNEDEEAMALAEAWEASTNF